MENNKLIVDVELNTENLKKQLEGVKQGLENTQNKSLDDLRQKLINYLYEMEPSKYDNAEFKILDIVFETGKKPLDITDAVVDGGISAFIKKY